MLLQIEGQIHLHRSTVWIDGAPGLARIQVLGSREHTVFKRHRRTASGSGQLLLTCLRHYIPDHSEQAILKGIISSKDLAIAILILVGPKSSSKPMVIFYSRGAQPTSPLMFDGLAGR